MQVPTEDFGAVVMGPPLYHRESWWRWFFRSLRETANPNTMHTEDLTAVELEKQASFEGLEYYRPYPDMYVEYLRECHRNRRAPYMEPSSEAGGTTPESVADPTSAEERALEPATVVVSHSNSSSLSAAAAAAGLSRSQVVEAFPILQMDKEERHLALRWLLHVLIAFSVGVIALCVSYAVDTLEKYRADGLYRIMKGSDRHRYVTNMIGFVYTIAGTLVLLSVAAGVVVYFEPAAAGGGIPDVMAYLNGVHLRKAMNLRTFIAKAISCVCAVAGGLPVGLEAPLIHLGAITGAGVTQGRSRTLGFQTRLFQAFRNNKDRRDFITAGAACGVSVAFGAPIGGLLFVMEEVSSFWDQSSSGQIFLATMLCFSLSTMINSIVEDRRLLGWVSNTASVLFEVNLTIPLNLISIVPSFFLGILIGSIAAFFTKANLLMIKWRRRVLRPYPFRRFMEPVVVGTVFAACMYLLSLAAPCTDVLGIEDVNETIHIWGTEDAGRLFNNTCTEPNTFSPLGTLNMASGKNTIRHLFSRQTAGEFGMIDLIAYFIMYFAFAMMSSGTAVAGGLVVPSLVIGAVFGRLYGLLLFKVAAVDVSHIPHGYAASSAWMDPGVFALIGAGAFLAGTSRMTMAICVIMVELSSELHYLLPVMVAIVMSKSTADWLCEPLYHQMLHMDSVPYLPQNIVKPEFEQLTAADVMASDVVMLRVREGTEAVLSALRDSTHHAFPIVELEEPGETQDTSTASPQLQSSSNSFQNGSKNTGRHSPGSVRPFAGPPPSSHDGTAAHVRYKFIGTVTREDLQVYFTLPQLQEYDASASTMEPRSPAPPLVPLTAPDSDGFGGRLAPCVLAIREMSWQQWMTQKSRLFFSTTDRYAWVRTHLPAAARTANEVGEREGEDAGNDALFVGQSGLPPVVDLSLIVNRSPWVIPPFFNLQMAYHTFRMMGLRHMVVVDGDMVAGMITRKDLLVDALRRRMKELSARIATTESTAPSLPPSYNNRLHNQNPNALSPQVLSRRTTPQPPQQHAAGAGEKKGEEAEEKLGSHRRRGLHVDPIAAERAITTASHAKRRSNATLTWAELEESSTHMPSVLPSAPVTATQLAVPGEKAATAPIPPSPLSSLFNSTSTGASGSPRYADGMPSVVSAEWATATAAAGTVRLASQPSAAPADAEALFDLSALRTPQASESKGA